MIRVRFIIIAAALLTALYASGAPERSDWDLINFDLLNLPREPGSHPLTYTMYYSLGIREMKSITDMERPIVFGGELVRTRSIDLADKKKAVNKAFDDLGWNFSILRTVMERAAQVKPNEMTNEEFWDDILSMAGVNGFVSDALGLITGVKDRHKYYEAITLQERFRNEAGKYFMGKAIKEAGKMISFVERLEVFLKARERDKQKWINRVAEDNIRQLARFYAQANKRLWEIAQNKEKAWVMRVSGSANAPFMFEEVTCVQQWTIKMELEKNPHGKNEKLTEEQFYGTFVGEYIGWLEAEALYSLQNWDAKYLVDEQLKRFMQTEILGYAPLFVSDIRVDQSWMKVYADGMGFGFKHSTKPTQAYNTYRLPVKVEVKAPDRLAKSIHTYTHVFMGDEEWMPGDKPQPVIKSQFQLVHNVSASGTISDEGISYSANWYLNHYATQDSIIIEGNIGDRLSLKGLGTIPLRSKGRDSSPLNKEGFNGKPNGSVHIHLDQSLNDLDKRGRIRYE